MTPYGQNSQNTHAQVCTSSDSVIQQEVCTCYLQMIILHCSFASWLVEANSQRSMVTSNAYDYMAMCMFSWALCVLVVAATNTAKYI